MSHGHIMYDKKDENKNLNMFIRNNGKLLEGEPVEDPMSPMSWKDSHVSTPYIIVFNSLQLYKLMT
jgi:hypothetical protein